MECLEQTIKKWSTSELPPLKRGTTEPPPLKRGTTELPPLKKGDRGGFYNGDKKSPLAPLFQRGEYRVLR